MTMRRVLIGVLAGSCLAAGGCGGGDDSGASDAAAANVEALAAPSLLQARRAEGSITVCAGKDTAGDQQDLIDRFNERYESQGPKADLLEFPESADEQRNQFVQRQEVKSSECDVFKADTVFMAELVSQGWLLDMSDYVATRAGEFIPSTLETVDVEGRRFGVPYDTDAGMLFYRTDQVSEPPSTWQELYAEARAKSGIVYQAASYEGLTCDFLELAFAAGGEVLSDDGKESVIDSPENLEALQLMVDGIEDGAAPKAVTTYMEEPSRRAFESGKPTFMRNWPYAYALGNMKGSKVSGRFNVAPLPAFEGAGRAGILGGKNYVISRFSENPAGAMLFIDFGTSAAMNRHRAVKFALAPVVDRVYDDPAVKRVLPFAADLREAVSQARARPVSPVYPQISQAIYKNVNAALSGQMSPQDALAKADAEINEALATF
jgi:multiple sugar transport system substrate-binding protein